MTEHHPNPRSADDRSLTRAQAQIYLADKIAREQRALADPRSFSTFPRSTIIEDAEWRLRWINCAPRGSWHGAAPLQDKLGVPMGGAYREDVGPGKALREARIRHGVHPISGIRPDGSPDFIRVLS